VFLTIIEYFKNQSKFRVKILQIYLTQYKHFTSLALNWFSAGIERANSITGGGFFTGYWLTTGSPTTLDPTSGLYTGDTASLSNAIFVGGWYTCTTKFSMTSGTSGVYVAPNCP